MWNDVKATCNMLIYTTLKESNKRQKDHIWTLKSEPKKGATKEAILEFPPCGLRFSTPVAVYIIVYVL